MKPLAERLPRPAPAAGRGLSELEAAALLAQHGPNALRKAASRAAWRILLAQYLSPVIGLLLLASGVSAALGEIADAVAIAAILLINGAVGFYQEYRAERAMSALRSLTSPRARVLREGQAAVIPSAQVVPGDLLLLEAGDVVAADAQLLEAYALQANEATLTGESVASEKSMLPDQADAPLAERHNRVFMGTAITSGTGVARVLATGPATELGKIADLLASAEESETPLQQRLAQISRTLMGLCLGVVGLVAAIGLARGLPWLEVLMSAVSLAVAAVPEGLPAIVTIALAMGVQRMTAQRVLVRRLHAIETIGCATVICTDKTGTLTTGAMTVRELWGADEFGLLFAAAACCDAQLGADGQAGVGDTTELALLLAALARGIAREDIERDHPRTGAIPFDSVRKRMAIRRANGVLYVKGAAESVLARCTSIPDGAADAAHRMASRGLRVLAIATGQGEDETGLSLLGMVGMADPPRPEAIAAVAAARRAGVQTVMITGDHPVTALAIARELGIVDGDESDTGRVHARATPEDKLRIVREWKSKGAIVAMTGDGVNDAPALREAHIGIAMGIAGTEVTREAADMILTDDNFASIVAALREGRAIFANIRKTIVYLLAGNTAELAVMLLAAAFGLPLPLLPLHILWINLATDGLPALALVTDPVADDVLGRPPRHPGEPLLGRSEWGGIIAIGAIQTAVTLSVFVWALDARGLDEARNLAFTTLVFGELFRAFGARSTTRTFWELGLLTNKRLLAVVLLSSVLQIPMHQLPVVEELLKIGPISSADCAMALLIGLIPLGAIETWKLATRWQGSRRRNSLL
jgi:Ca2+-transporting ATPase